MAVAALVALQALAMAGNPVLDAAIESSAARLVIHIEGVNGSKCAAVHVGDCLVCRTLTDRGTPASGAPAVPVGTDTGGVATAAFFSVASRLVVSSLRSRAPPGAWMHAPVA